jgi:NADPH:quinone reductase-like Zn-dependent oxidoreductase
VQGLGADRVIDYTQNDFSAGAQRYDLIFDLVGNHPLAAIRRSLTRNGTLVLSNGSGSPVLGPLGRIARAVILSPFISQNLHPFAASRSSDNLDLLRELIEAGTITPAIDRTYQLSDTAEAIRYFAEDHARAKIAIIVRSD